MSWIPGGGSINDSWYDHTNADNRWVLIRVSNPQYQRRVDTDTTSNMSSDTNFFETSDSDTGSDMRMSENLGHGFGLGKLSDTRFRPSVLSIGINDFCCC